METTLFRIKADEESSEEKRSENHIKKKEVFSPSCERKATNKANSKLVKP
jgi:hypothetical protein